MYVVIASSEIKAEHKEQYVKELVKVARVSVVQTHMQLPHYIKYRGATSGWLLASPLWERRHW
jgi:hypothetical protein